MTRRATIDPAKRAAIWEAHNRRCIYSSERIDISELAIDHLIPLEGGDATLADLQVRGLVSADFDLNGFENLVPTHGPRNRQKSELMLDEGPLVYFLQFAQGKASRASTLYNEMLERDRALNGYLLIQASAQRNGVTVDGLFEVLKHQNAGDVPLRIAPAIEGTAVYSANSAVAASLMEMPFALAGANIGEVPLEGPQRDERLVRTSSEFLAAKAAGYRPISQFAMNMWAWADATSEMLRAVKNSQFALNSEIRFPPVTLANLDRWSSDWLTRNAAEGPPAEHLACRTIAELIRKGFATVVVQEQWHVDIEYAPGFSTRLSELMRADLDGDGHEEILLGVVAYARRGTFRSGGAQMAKMRDGLLIPLAVPHVAAPSPAAGTNQA